MTGLGKKHPATSPGGDVVGRATALAGCMFYSSPRGPTGRECPVPKASSADDGWITKAPRNCRVWSPFSRCSTTQRGVMLEGRGCEERSQHGRHELVAAPRSDRPRGNVTRKLPKTLRQRRSPRPGFWRCPALIQLAYAASSFGVSPRRAIRSISFLCAKLGKGWTSTGCVLRAADLVDQINLMAHGGRSALRKHLLVV